MTVNTIGDNATQTASGTRRRRGFFDRLARIAGVSF
jgi:hypothetical protein